MGKAGLPKNVKNVRPKERDTPKNEIKTMLGNDSKFNSGEIEKLKGNRQWGEGSLDAYTDNMLRRGSGVGSMIDSRKTNSIVSCVFKDNAVKPKTVTDLRLSVNIPETLLIGSASRLMDGTAYVEINPSDQEEYLKIIDGSEELEKIRERGFSGASNLMVSILGAVNLDFQVLENYKDRREILIREYEDTDEASLPDERYRIRLCYFNQAQLFEERAVYDAELKNLGADILRLWDLLEVIYRDSKSVFKVNDYEDLVKKNKNRVNDFSAPPKLQEARNDPAQEEKQQIRVLLAKMEERLTNISDSMYPAERQITLERLSLQKNKFSCFENRVNPANLQPGIFVDIDLTSVKRKRTTLDSMSAVIDRFTDGVANCFN